jgi:UPF0755 protein
MLKKIFYLLTILLIVGCVAAYWAYDNIFTPNTNFQSDTIHIKILKNASYADVLDSIKSKNILQDYSSFDRVAGWMNYKRQLVPSGHYVLKNGWNNKQLVTKLRSGVQEAVNLTFNNVRTIEDLMGPLSANISLDSSDLVAYYTDPNNLTNLGYTKETILTLFIPNTYQVYWDVSIEQLTNKMVNEHKSFWNQNDRKAKLQALGMSESEVYTLASIVEKESQHGPERPTIAGLYLNRLKQGIHLQADPTVVFANGDFGLRRVLNKHLEYDSPYNTYKYSGLPPGPIYMPSIESIDAVLNPEQHEYLFMCAKPGFGTQHAFAKTLRGHNQNAQKYRSWLNQQGIK